MVSAPLGDLVQQPFGILPSQAGIGDGFAVDVIVDSLISLFDIALISIMTPLTSPRMSSEQERLWSTSFTMRICSLNCLLELLWLASTMQAGFFRSLAL